MFARVLFVLLFLAGCKSPVSSCPHIYEDKDGDGWGVETNSKASCTVESGFSQQVGDCDDNDAYINPDQFEKCDDNNVDEDCNGRADDADDDPQNATFFGYPDNDGDGFGDLDSAKRGSCEPSNTVDNNTDCNDDDRYAYVGAAELESEEDCMRDADGDGWGDDSPGLGVVKGRDCDDANDERSPSEAEVLSDGVDQNCDGTDDIFEDFDIGNPSGSWNALGGNAVMTTAYSLSPPHSVLFDGSGDLTLMPIDARGCYGINYSFWVKRASAPDTPETSDWLRLQWSIDGTLWTDAEQVDGGSEDVAFVEHKGAITHPATISDTLQLRFLTNGSSSDDWYLDDVSFSCVRNPDNDGDGYRGANDCDDNDPLHWSDCTTCVDADGDGRGASCNVGSDCIDTDPQHWSDCGSCIDLDNDGRGPSCDLGEDCNEADATVHEGAPDVPDGIDQDCDGFDITWVSDDFDTGLPSTTAWTGLAGAASTSSTYSNSGGWSLQLGGTSSTAASAAFDASSCNRITWSYQGKRGPTPPDSTDVLELEYETPTGWQVADTWAGDGGDDSTFSLRQGVLTDSAASWAQLRVRLVVTTSISSETFYVDDFRVGCAGNDNDGDGVTAGADCDDNDARHWSDCGQCTDTDLDGRGTGCDLGDDCIDTDDQHWADCGTCTDIDGDDHGTGCDLGDDCNETDTTVHVGATDPADGIDQDCDGFDVVWLVDDFEQGTPDSAVWAVVVGDADISSLYSAAGDYSLNLGGGVGTATTVQFDASACGAITWSYLGKRGPEVPDGGEYLRLEYETATGWIEADAWEGTTTTDSTFGLRSGTVSDPGAAWANLRFRLITNGSGTGTDDFFVDDFTVGCAGNDADGDGIVAGADCDDNAPLHWADCGSCTDVDLDGRGTGCDLGDDCIDSDDAHWADCGACTDVDGDDRGTGCDLGGDCNELDTTIYQGAVEVVDGRDQDCDGLDAAWIYDDFDSGSLASSTWASQTGSAAPSTSHAWSGSTSLALGGTTSQVVTVPFDATSCTAIEWTYQGKRVGPDSNELLVVEYETANGWVTADSWEGTGSTDSAFELRMAQLSDPDASWASLRFRLTANASLTSEIFYVDDFAVGCAADDLDGDGIVAGTDCDDSAPLHWADCGSCTDTDLDGRGTGCDLGDDCIDTDDQHWSDCGACTDLDGDDHGTGCDLGDDCNESDVLVHEGATDPADGVDQNCDGLDITWVFDDFDTGMASVAMWDTITGDASVVNTFADSGSWSLNLGGGGGTATTITFDASTCGGISWSYRGKRGPEQPDSTDFLTLEYETAAGWVQAERWAGGDTDSTFSSRAGVISDPDAAWASLRLRLVSNGSGATYDDFFVDDFAIGCSGDDLDGDGVPAGPDCDDASNAHWDDCATCIDTDGDDYGVDCNLGDDCDDTDAAVNPEGTDTARDGIDDDCDGLDGLPLLFDDFELGAYDGLYWLSYTGDSQVSSGQSWSGTYSANLGGAAGDATTANLNTAICTGTIHWSAEIRRGPEPPDSGEDFTLSWGTGAGFTTVLTVPGGNGSDPDFVHYEGDISDVAAFSTMFQLQLATAGGTAGNDDFWIDDLTVGCGL